MPPQKRATPKSATPPEPEPTPPSAATAAPPVDVPSADPTEREQSAEAHPSGDGDDVTPPPEPQPALGPITRLPQPGDRLGVVVDGGQVSIVNYEPVSGADGPNSQTELDNG